MSVELKIVELGKYFFQKLSLNIWKNGNPRYLNSISGRSICPIRYILIAKDLLNFGPLHQRTAPLRFLGTFYSSRRARKFMSRYFSSLIFRPSMRLEIDLKTERSGSEIWTGVGKSSTHWFQLKHLVYWITGISHAFEKWLSGAKLKARSEASCQILEFKLLALRAFSFVSLKPVSFFEKFDNFRSRWEFQFSPNIEIQLRFQLRFFPFI